MNTITFQNATIDSSMPVIPHKNGKVFSRLVSAAVVNQRFCDLLLNNPTEALENGYGGKPFRLAREEQDLVLSIRAANLPDFAMQLVEHRKNGKGNGNGNGHWFSTKKSMVLMDPR